MGDKATAIDTSDKMKTAKGAISSIKSSEAARKRKLDKTTMALDMASGVLKTAGKATGTYGKYQGQLEKEGPTKERRRLLVSTLIAAGGIMSTVGGIIGIV